MNISAAIRRFEVDVTPPVGGYLCGGLHDRSIGVETPLYLRGVEIGAKDDRYILACVDFCYLCGPSHQRLQEAIANAAGIAMDRVALHANHVHDAPLIDEIAHGIVHDCHPQWDLHDEGYFQSILSKTQDAVECMMRQPAITIDSVSFSNHPVREFASTRRVIDETGRCRVRYSVCSDPALRDKPEGPIDPMLSLVTLYGHGGEAPASLAFYASHPQVSDGRRMVSSDTIGVARDLFEKTYPGTFLLYFTGCAGDVTAGKYSTSNRSSNRLDFGLKLFDAMASAFDRNAPEKLGRVTWKSARASIPMRPAPNSIQELTSTLEQISDRRAAYLTAMKLARVRDYGSDYPFDLKRLSLGDIQLLFLPAELCVEYQHYAKRVLGPKSAVAAYGDCFLKYIATDIAFDQGGYEVEPAWTEVGPGIEPIVKRAIDTVAL